MSETSVFAKYVATPNDSVGAEIVDRPCMLRGVWIVPHASVNIDVFLTDGSKSGTERVILESMSQYTACGYTFPGNGVRYDQSLWVRGDGDSNMIKSITVFYQ